MKPIPTFPAGRRPAHKFLFIDDHRSAHIIAVVAAFNFMIVIEQLGTLPERTRPPKVPIAIGISEAFVTFAPAIKNLWLMLF